jgi:hypothetical protein
MADSFPMFDLNEPVSEDDDDDNVEFDLNDHEYDTAFALHDLEDEDGDAGLALYEPEDDDGDAVFDLNDPPLEHGNGITCSSLCACATVLLCYLFVSIVSHIIVFYCDRI